MILFIVGFAALHVAFRLSPNPVRQKLRGVIAAGLNKIGLKAMAQRLGALRQVGDSACGSCCDECGSQTADDELTVDTGTKVVQFHPRLR